MKKEFSKKWKSSKQPRKQRKYAAKAPLHIKRNLLSANLSKELRKKYGMRNISLVKGDVVKIMRGKFSKKKGKVLEVETVSSRVVIEGIQVKKKDGSKVNVKIQASNVQITELNLNDKKRMRNQETKQVKKTETKTTAKKEIAEDKK